jgi:hypothetical protein
MGNNHELSFVRVKGEFVCTEKVKYFFTFRVNTGEQCKNITITI